MQRRSLLTTLASATLPLPTLAHGEKSQPPQPGAAPKEQKDWGIAGDTKGAHRTVVIRMTDQMRFKPGLVNVKLGQTLRFDIRNEGRMLHEMVIGTTEELAQHAALMLKFPNMEHGEPYMAHVAAGRTGQIVWTFNRAGDFEFACLIAGHYQAGMKGRINVRV
jgi:uncharacterized cupredoxin-like copper-binding protein